DADGDGEIQPRSFLLDVRWREVDGDFLCREMKARVLERRTHPVSALPHGRVRQTDDGKLRKPAGDVHFDIDEVGVESDQGDAAHFRQHEQSSVDEGERLAKNYRKPARTDSTKTLSSTAKMRPFRISISGHCEAGALLRASV